MASLGAIISRLLSYFACRNNHCVAVLTPTCCLSVMPAKQDGAGDGDDETLLISLRSMPQNVRNLSIFFTSRS